MKAIRWFFLVFSFSCINMIIQDDNKYNSIYFNGGSWIDFAQIENMKLSPSANQFTLQFWVSGSDITVFEAPAIFSIVDSNEKIKLTMFRDAGSNSTFTIKVNDDVFESITTDQVELDWSDPNNFYLISLLFSENTDLKVYINKEKLNNIDIDTGNAGPIDVGDASLMFGVVANTGYNVLESFWYGYIDEIRLWNTLLSEETIQFQYEQPNKFSKNYRATEDGEEIPTHLDSLIGLWRFNLTNATTTMIDESGNGNDGTIYTLPNYFIELSERGVQ